MRYTKEEILQVLGVEMTALQIDESALRCEWQRVYTRVIAFPSFHESAHLAWLESRMREVRGAIEEIQQQMDSMSRGARFEG
jgi:hypothetical protein